MTVRFLAAPWSPTLRAVSFLGAVGLCVLSYAAYRAIPKAAGFIHWFGLGVALIPLLALLACILFVVRGYTVSRDLLCVQRLCTATTVSLTGLQRVWHDDNVCKGSLRVVGNGGLYAFSGWFYSRRLGRFRLFVTDFRNSVVLKFADRVVVISPAAPLAFIEHLTRILPGVCLGPEDTAS